MPTSQSQPAGTSRESRNSTVAVTTDLGMGRTHDQFGTLNHDLWLRMLTGWAHEHAGERSTPDMH